jgi:hypothetical protein
MFVVVPLARPGVRLARPMLPATAIDPTFYPRLRRIVACSLTDDFMSFFVSTWTPKIIPYDLKVADGQKCGAIKSYLPNRHLSAFIEEFVLHCFFHATIPVYNHLESADIL